jgi:hypothetical protein
MTTRLGLMLTSTLLIGWAGATSHAQRGFGPGGFGPGGFGAGMGKVVAGEPYTATVTATSLEKLANGTTITRSSTITEARDSQGRTYRCVTTPPSGASAQGFVRTTVMDPVAHTITEWGTQSTTATQFQLPSNTPGGHGAWAGGKPGGSTSGPGPGAGDRFHGQVTRTPLPAKSIAGVNAEGVRTTITVPAGAQGNDKPLVSMREVWTSTDLKIVLLETSDDPREGSHKTEVTSLTPGESDPTLFQVPQGYTVQTQTRHRGN